MVIHQPISNLHIVDLDQPLEGFHHFLSSWIYQCEGVTFIVDPGPRSTIPVLLTALKQQQVKKVDYILLTHIHIDHAGGAGVLVKHFPETKVVCHPKGIRHMMDPTKLWEGSRKTLGKVAETYGDIAAIPEKNLQDHMTAIGGGLVTAIETPGHAIHHLCYQIKDLLFIGEAAGIHYPVHEGLYLRIATPPPFIYEIYRDSLKKAAALHVSHVCFGHYGYRQDAKHIFDTALDQLDNWLAAVEKHDRMGSTPFEETVFDDLLKNDRGLSRYHALPLDIQARERFFAMNSIRGMRNYLKDKVNHPA